MGWTLEKAIKLADQRAIKDEKTYHVIQTCAKFYDLMEQANYMKIENRHKKTFYIAEYKN